MAEKIEPTKYPGVYTVYKHRKKLLATKGPDCFFNETLDEYREWSPKRSKIAAALVKRIKHFPIKEKTSVLYLGASHGYTCSFLANITKGPIFAVEFAPRVTRDLLVLTKKLDNFIPIFADAKKPENYQKRITPVDVVFQDVAQKDQVKIFLDNLQLAKPKAYGLLALKTKSIDVTKKSRQIAQAIERELKNHVKVLEVIDLHPFQKGHYMFVCQKR